MAFRESSGFSSKRGGKRGKETPLPARVSRKYRKIDRELKKRSGGLKPKDEFSGTRHRPHDSETSELQSKTSNGKLQSTIRGVRDLGLSLSDGRYMLLTRRYLKYHTVKQKQTQSVSAESGQSAQDVYGGNKLDSMVLTAWSMERNPVARTKSNYEAVATPQKEINKAVQKLAGAEDKFKREHGETARKNLSNSAYIAAISSWQSSGEYEPVDRIIISGEVIFEVELDSAAQGLADHLKANAGWSGSLGDKEAAKQMIRQHIVEQRNL
jgi:hypothetical protein